MKIGIFNGGYWPNPSAGGGTTFQHAVLSSLVQKTSNHTFYFFCDEEVQASLQALTVFPLHRSCSSKNDALIKKIVLRGLRLCDWQWCRWQYKSFLQRAVREHAIDIVWFLIPVYQHVEVPYVFTVWDLQHRLQPYFPEVSVTGSTFDERERIYGHVLPRASYVVVGNQAGKEEIERFYGLPAQRVKVNPMPTPQFALGEHRGKCPLFIKNPFLLYPAQFWPHKNHVVIVHALKLLREKHGLAFDVVLTGADKGNMHHIKELVIELNLQEVVHFLGFVDQKTLVALYQQAFALIFASFFGPDNIPPLEAFGLGCPVIAARVSGAEYQLEEAALLFDPKSEHELAEKIIKLHGDASLRQKLVDFGKQRALLFSSDHYVENMLQIFDEFEPIRRCWSSTIPYRHL